jgi:hypothetical protein
MKKLSQYLNKGVFKQFTENRSNIKFTNPPKPTPKEYNQQIYIDDLGYVDVDQFDNGMDKDLSQKNNTDKPGMGKSNNQNLRRDNIDRDKDDEFK